MALRAPAQPATHRVPWTLRDTLLASLTAVALVAVGVEVRNGAGWLLSRSGLAPPSGTVRVLTAFALEAVLIVPAWFWGPHRHGGGWASLGFRRFPFTRSAVLGSASLAFIMVINTIWDIVRRRMGWPGQPDYLPLFGEGLAGLAVALLLGAGVAPVAEEVFFRGYLYTGLRERWGLGWGLVASALLFAVVHLVPGVLPPVFFTGLVLATVYEANDSLWPCIILHGTINALAFIAAYVVRQLPT